MQAVEVHLGPAVCLQTRDDGIERSHDGGGKGGEAGQKKRRWAIGSNRHRSKIGRGTVLVIVLMLVRVHHRGIPLPILY